MDHKGPGGKEGDIGNSRRNRAGQARLDDAVDKVAVPPRYSQHIDLGMDDIAEAKVVPSASGRPAGFRPTFRARSRAKS